MLTTTTGTIKMNLFTKYLEETLDKVSGDFTTLKWLQCVDTDSLDMLQGYIDNFDGTMPVEKINCDEVEDSLTLIQRCAALEQKSNKIGKLTSLVQLFFGMVVFESLRRKGMITIKGSGKITDDDTSMKLTALGKAAHTAIQK